MKEKYGYLGTGLLYGKLTFLTNDWLLDVLKVMLGASGKEALIIEESQEQ